MILRRVPVAVFIGCLSIASSAQTGASGKWSGTMEGTGGMQFPIEVTLAGTGGTWQMLASDGRGRRTNPCMGKELPLVAETRGDQLILDIKGAEVITGCLDQKLTLTLVNGEYKGALRGGRAVTLTRK